MIKKEGKRPQITAFKYKNLLPILNFYHYIAGRKYNLATS